METHFYWKLDVLGQMLQKRMPMGRTLKAALSSDMIPTYKRLWGKRLMLKIIANFITGIISCLPIIIYSHIDTFIFQGHIFFRFWSI